MNTIKNDADKSAATTSPPKEDKPKATTDKANAGNADPTEKNSPNSNRARDSANENENGTPRKRSSPRGASTPKLTPKIPKRTIPGEATEGSQQHNDSALSQQTSHDKLTCTPKIQSSFVLCCGFLAFGSSMAIIGPTVLELGCLIGADVGDMSWVFFAQTCSALMGAICSGIITDRFEINYNVYLAIVLTIHAVALAVLPFMRALSTLLLFTGMHGLFGGFQDTATNLRMIIMHGAEVPPYLQTLFFFYGVGAFLSPIIAGNFLSDQCNYGDTDISDFAFARKRRGQAARHITTMVKNKLDVLVEHLSGGSQGHLSPRSKRHNGMGNSHWIRHNGEDVMLLNVTHPHKIPVLNTEHQVDIKQTMIHWSYFIVAFIHVAVTAGLWYLFVIERRRRRDQLSLSRASTTMDTESMSGNDTQMDDTMSRSDRSEIDPMIKTQVVVISFWIAVMVFISDGLQGSFGSYIYTYAIKSNVGISTDDAAYLNSLFWGSLALGRLIAIFISMYISPKVMLLVDIIGCLGSITAMFLFRTKIISLWIGTACFGLCLSNIFPTSVSMAESYYRLTGTITCIFVVCSGLGEMAIPLLIGKLFDVIGPVSFLVISCVLCFTSVGIYCAVIITGRGLNRQMDAARSLSHDDLKDVPTPRHLPSIEPVKTLEPAQQNLKDSTKRNPDDDLGPEDGDRASESGSIHLNETSTGTADHTLEEEGNTVVWEGSKGGGKGDAKDEGAVNKKDKEGSNDRGSEEKQFVTPNEHPEDANDDVDNDKNIKDGDPSSGSKEISNNKDEDEMKKDTREDKGKRKKKY